MESLPDRSDLSLDTAYLLNAEETRVVSYELLSWLWPITPGRLLAHVFRGTTKIVSRVSNYAGANQVWFFDHHDPLEPSLCWPQLCLLPAIASQRFYDLRAWISPIFSSSGLGQGKRAMDLQFSSLTKAKRSREGARGAPKVKTGCQTCKYASRAVPQWFCYSWW